MSQRRAHLLIMAFWATLGIVRQGLEWTRSAAEAWGADVPAFLWHASLMVTVPILVIGFWLLAATDNGPTGATR